MIIKEEVTRQQWELFDSVRDTVVVVCEQGRIAFINSQAEQVFGYSRAELVGKSLETLFPACFHARQGQHFARCFSNLNTRQMGMGLELLGLRKNGEEFPVEIALSLVEHRGTNMVVAAIRDITTTAAALRDVVIRKQVEDELRQSREELAVTLASIRDGVIVADLQGRVVRLNPIAERLTGWSAEDAEGQSLDKVFRIINEETREAVTLHDGGVVGLPLNTILIARNGTEIPIEDCCAPIRVAEEELRGVLLVFGDNIAKAAEQKFLREAKRIQEQLDMVPLTTVRLDRHGRITHVNEAWRRFAHENGANAETLEGVGLDYIDVARHVKEERTELADAFAEILAGRKETFTSIYPCHSSQEIRWFKLDVRKLPHEDALFVTHTNITDRYLAEARLRVQTIVAQALAEHTPLLDTCRHIMKATCVGLEWDFAAIWMSTDGERLLCAESWSKPECDVRAFEHATRTAEFKPGFGLPGLVWASRLPLWIVDNAVDAVDAVHALKVKKGLRAPIALANGLRSSFAVPLVAEGEVFAVLEFFGRIRREADFELLELLATAGAQLGAQVHQKRAEQRAVEAEEAKQTLSNMLDSIVECAPAFIYVVDADGIIQFINRGLPPFKREEMVGTNWQKYLPPKYHEESQARLRAIIDTGVSVNTETALTGADGRKMYFANHMGPMRKGDRIVGAVVVSQEVTELKQAQAEFMTVQRLAAIGTLAAGVAHEINTPVQFVNDSIHFLRDATRDVLGFLAKLQAVNHLVATGVVGAELQQAIGDVAKAEEEADFAFVEENVPKAFESCIDGLERISMIVRSMKEFAHPDKHEMVATDLNRAIQNTLTIACSEYRFVADTELELGELPPVTCYLNDINQVVLNLVINAAHAIGDVVQGSGKKGMIKVRTWQDGEQAVISISDTGTGISKTVASRIFEPFFTTKEVGKGTGQGLALAWSVVKEKHGGELSFESKVGAGTTFFIRLPIDGKQPELFQR